MSHPSPHQDIIEQLNLARRELLYLGLRNPLINYRPLAVRGAEVVQAKGAPVFQRLVDAGEPLHFAAVDDDGQPAEAADGILPTPYTAAELQKRLRHSQNVARTYIEEQGVNVLYLAVGMLTWYETERSQQERYAPLILVPVKLHRTAATEPYQLAYTGIDLTINLSLAAKLRIDYDLKLPNFPPDGIPDPGVYANLVQTAVGRYPRWRVDADRIALGFFSFSKYIMFNDLDPEQWPKAHHPAGHPVIRALLTPGGFAPQPAAVGADDQIDPHIDLHHSRLVLDADSSQMRAILDAEAGRHLVIQGPPGTGKSQTITNLIATAVGQGKRVLFVSEKMAALNVVERRLNGVGLGAATLAIHSHDATKKHLLAELHRTLHLGAPRENGRFAHYDDLTRTRDHLNAYSEAMNTPIGDSGHTPFAAYGRLIQLEAQRDWEADIPGLARLHTDLQPARWTAAQAEAHHAYLTTVMAHLRQMGVPEQHPFWGSRATEATQTAADRHPILAQWERALSEYRQALAPVAAQMSLPAPQTTAAADRLLKLAARTAEAPNLYEIDPAPTDWLTHHAQIAAALTAGEELARLRQTYSEQLIPEAWEADVLGLRESIIAVGPKWWRFLSGDYRAARRRLAGLCRTEPPGDWWAQLALVDAILAHQRLRPQVAQQADRLQKLFGGRYGRAGQTDWVELDEIARWLHTLHEEIEAGQLPGEVLDYISRGLRHDERVGLQTAVQRAQVHRRPWVDAHQAAVDMFAFPSDFGAEMPLGDLADRVSRCLREVERFPQIAAYNRLIARLDEHGLRPLEPTIESWSAAATHLSALHNYLWMSGLVDRALLERYALSGFAGETQTTAVQHFRRLDLDFLHHNRQRLAYEHWRQLPHHEAGGRVGVLLAETAKKTNMMPIRQVMETLGPAVQHLKPIFMMNPLAIAAYLPPGEIMFDLVIFDEASQVRPVDAFGAILRGRQTIVVGDSKQLPPTAFFSRLLGEEEEAGSHLIGDSESILDLFVARHAPQRMLRWHYRSRHESLIALSNREFYDGRLVLFPSPDVGRTESGLRLHHHPHTVYDRGGTRTNEREAERVAEAVIAHAAAHPQQTLGVAAFSAAQREAIETAVEQLRREHPAVEPFFAREDAEPFFIKNLENVQGDERDVIFISLGYGRDADGRITMNFGPLNAAGGERRLNVLITRARRRCEIFSNLAADDIDLNRTDAAGVRALKAYLHFAATGELAERGGPDGAGEYPFAAVVIDALAAHGYEAAQRIGRGGVEIDVAVRHPDRPGRYLLGIELDGPDYHRAKAARDRDRIQQEVLARLGWHIHRVWSTDWLKDGPAQIERVLAALAHAQQGPPQPPPFPTLGVARYDGPEKLPPRTVPAYDRAAFTIPEAESGRSLLTLTNEQNAAYLARIVHHESPVYIQDAFRHLSHLAGNTRLVVPANRRSDIVRTLLSGEYGVVRRDDFLWRTDMQVPPLRSRADLPPASRKWRQVCPAEIAEAVLLLARDGLGLRPYDFTDRVFGLLGFGNLGHKKQNDVIDVVRGLWEDGRLQGDELWGYLTVGEL